MKSNLGKLWTVFSPQISFMGRNVPFKMMGKITVMLLYHLSRRLLRMWNLFFNYCFVRINIFWIYLAEIKHQRWWNFPTLFTISFKSVNSTSLLLLLCQLWQSLQFFIQIPWSCINVYPNYEFKNAHLKICKL